MPRKPALDATGTAVLLAVTLLFAANQAVIKLVTVGLQPVFFAGLRSVLAVGFVAGWMAYRRIPLNLSRAMLPVGLLIGVVFSAEFLFLFLALDLTTLGRASVIFYSMPVWFALMAHYGLPGNGSRGSRRWVWHWLWRVRQLQFCRVAMRGRAA